MRKISPTPLRKNYTPFPGERHVFYSPYQSDPSPWIAGPGKNLELREYKGLSYLCVSPPWGWRGQCDECGDFYSFRTGAQYPSVRCHACMYYRHWRLKK